MEEINLPKENRRGSEVFVNQEIYSGVRLIKYDEDKIEAQFECQGVYITFGLDRLNQLVQLQRSSPSRLPSSAFIKGDDKFNAMRDKATKLLLGLKQDKEGKAAEAEKKKEKLKGRKFLSGIDWEK